MTIHRMTPAVTASINVSGQICREHTYETREKANCVPSFQVLS
jgi:hypothetical protein